MKSEEPSEPRVAVLEAAISELQAAATSQTEYADDRGSPSAASLTESELALALDRMERRLEEQEQSLRHVLTMLIEWLEDDPSREAA